MPYLFPYHYDKYLYCKNKCCSKKKKHTDDIIPEEKQDDEKSMKDVSKFVRDLKIKA